MELRQLRYFVRIVETGSMGRAALDLNIGVSALSQQIARLENELAIRLLQRTSRGVTPTSAGLAFYSQAQLALRHADDAILAAREARLSGHVSVGMAPSTASVLGVPFINAMRESYPDVRLQAVSARNDALEAGLLGGELDMALLFGEAENEKLDYQLIASDEVILAAGRKTALAQRVPSGSTVSLSACEGEKFVLPAENLPFAREYSELLARAALSPFVALRTDDSQCAKRVCAACSLVMLCPFITLLSDTPAMQQLAHYRLSDAVYTPLYMAHPKDMPLTPYAQALYTTMSNRFRAMTAYRL